MKLFYTPLSPYARVTRIVALIFNSPVSFVQVAVRESASVLLQSNPAAKVPSLQLRSGVVLSETRLVCEHLQSLGGQRLLASADDHSARQWEGLVSGFMDGIAVWVRERRRPADEQSPAVLALEQQRCVRCLAYFEQSWDCEQRVPDYAAIALACTLELISVCALMDWEAQHPRLAAWLAPVLASELFKQTAPQV